MYKIILFIFVMFGPKIIIAQNLNETVKCVIEEKSWGNIFNSPSIEGTFILHKLNSDTLKVYNLERAEKGYLPASTFKILNSLIFLETNVIKDENEIIEWDGIERFYDKWNTDQSLKTALKYSCVWFYQELARRVGPEKMQYYLDTVKYGNSKIGADIDKFWLEGELRISASEQIEFLINFLEHKLPFTDRSYNIVKNIMLVDSTDNYKLYAKTGWAARIPNQIGWYVGFLERNLETWIFAMNIDIYDDKDAKYRELLTRKILLKEGLLN